ncbi:MAG: hypothetical protein AAB833_00175 [Patescibacteria group bacterium]
MSPLIFPTIILTFAWFLIYWLFGGVLFAVVALSKFVRVNPAVFSCWFTLLSIATAFGAAWTGIFVLEQSSAAQACFNSIQHFGDIALVEWSNCNLGNLLIAGSLWFIFLLAVGIGLMFVAKLPEAKPRKF